MLYQLPRRNRCQRFFSGQCRAGWSGVPWPASTTWHVGVLDGPAYCSSFHRRRIRVRNEYVWAEGMSDIRGREPANFGSRVNDVAGTHAPILLLHLTVDPAIAATSGVPRIATIPSTARSFGSGGVSAELIGRSSHFPAAIISNIPRNSSFNRFFGTFIHSLTSILSI